MTVHHFSQEIARLKEDILKMGGLVEEALEEATRALVSRDSNLAREVIKKDTRIDDLENAIDSFAIKLIATRQPVAADLRFLAGALRIGSTLERTADQAVNIADRTLVLNDLATLEPFPATLLEMAELAKEMTRKCLDAFVRRDVSLAYEVCGQDDELDDLNRRLLEEMIGVMIDEQRLIRRGVEVILAGRHYERIGDQATNVAEEVVYMVEGRVIRHHNALGRQEETGPSD
ncbi:MAG: phosphate signaling complex protein PhoU [Thermodesulfobacteriota bacterium]